MEKKYWEVGGSQTTAFSCPVSFDLSFMAESHTCKCSRGPCSDQTASYFTEPWSESQPGVTCGDINPPWFRNVHLVSTQHFIHDLHVFPGHRVLGLSKANFTCRSVVLMNTRIICYFVEESSKFDLIEVKTGSYNMDILPIEIIQYYFSSKSSVKEIN